MNEDSVGGQTDNLEHVMNVRQSVHHIQHKLNSTAREVYEDVEEDRQWNLYHLKKIFQTKDLQDLFDMYIQRLNQSFFALLMLLQSGLFAVHFVIVASSAESLTSNLLDLTLYAFVVFISIVMLFITDGPGYKVLSDRTLKLMSLMFFVLLSVVNMAVPLYNYYYYNAEIQLRPAYTKHIIISCYVFLFVSNFVVTLVFGLVASVIHFLVLIFVSYNGLESTVLTGRLLSDAIEILCINALGIYYSYLNEIIKRRSFLDRRACVIFNRHLEFQEQQEKQLMGTLIPSYVADNVKDSISNYLNRLENVETDSVPFEYKTSFTQKFENVTILYADVVNYTEMTVKLNINELLETLNELFGNFDDVSERLKVLRIKFLGDCYYCVSGLPPDIPENHAEACVDLGLEMIRIINEVRKKRNININMRIGIHTGKIISGIIGYQKIHFDVWSKDVSLANQMETEGEPGKVHITQHTKNLLSKQYNIEPTLKGETVPQFKKLGIQTYLITPDNMDTSTDKKLENGSIYVKNRNSYTSHPKISANSKNIPKNSSASSLDSATKSNSEILVENEKGERIQPKKVKYYNIIETSYAEDEDISQRKNTENTTLRVSDKSDSRDSQRRIAFMNSNIRRYKDMMQETYTEMQDNIRKLSLSKYEQWFKYSEINPMTLVFKEKSYEKDFHQTQDPLFKYYLLSELVLVIFLYLIQNFTLTVWNWESWWIYSTLAVISLIFLPLVWMNYFFEYKYNKILRHLAHISRVTTQSIWVRLFIYTVVCVLFSLCVFSELIDCRERIPTEDVYEASHVSRKSVLLLFHRQLDYGVCIVPWHMTQTCTLAIIVTFLFLRMIMWVKFLYASIITILYAVCVWYLSDDILATDLETYNYGLDPKITHILNVAFLTFTLHIIDRQSEYLNRLDFIWNRNLKKEQTKIKSRYIVNKMLLNNVLPEHLAEMYLDITRPPAALYHEKYADAAVMFASVVACESKDLGDDVLLSTMTQVIEGFDKLIMKGGFGHRIEKIKVAKWTYMTACGISPGYGEVEQGDPSTHVEALLRFASAMMNQLSKTTNEFCPDMKLRIGISNGEIVAGVVGSKKPLYDIWGDPVNMASRMDTTGEPNKIHVLEHTANIIRKIGYKCTLRGETSVKGLKGPVPTYFVELDRNFILIRDEEK